MLGVRNADLADFDRIMEIYKSAQDFMISSGNPLQWGSSYPPAEMIKDDIEHKVCRVIYDKNGIHGVFALFDGIDPTYVYIENGAWLNDEPYVTIHRLAGDGQVHGVFKCAVNYCMGISKNIRVDTHSDNKVMQKLILQSGFVECGTIYVADKTPRIAYQLRT